MTGEVLDFKKMPKDNKKFHYRPEVAKMNEDESLEKASLWAENLKNNRPLAQKNRNVDAILKDAKWSQLECLVVGAGPSLDFDLATIKKYRRNVKILCVDAALHPLVKNGIKPDWVFSKNDEKTVVDLVSGFPTKDLRLIGNLLQPPELFAKWKGELFTYIPYDASGALRNIASNCPELSKILKKPDTFAMAVIFARCMKFKRIYLIGGDYCFYDVDKLYCSDVLYPSVKGLYDVEKDRLVDLDNVFLDKTHTTYSLYYQSEDLFKLIMLEDQDQVMNCSQSSILYNLNWSYFKHVMEYKETKKQDFFEFANVFYDAKSHEINNSNELTTNYFKAVVAKNMYDNRERFKKSKTVGELLNNKEQFKDKVCLVCGTAPSLQENLPLIKEHRDKFVIMGVDSSLFPLYLAGIEPDYILNIDAARVCGDFVAGYPAGKNTKLIASVGSHSHLVNSWENEIYFYFPTPIKNIYFWLLNTIEGYSKVPFLTPLNNCGSTSVIFALDLGFREIAITGMDFAFTNNKMYTAGSRVKHSDDKEAEGEILKSYHGNKLIKMMDCRGNEVQTDETFAFYARTLEVMVFGRKYTNVTNVGAGIMKIPYMPFDEFIEKKVIVKPS